MNWAMVIGIGWLIFSVLNSSRGTRKLMVTLTRNEEFSRNLLALFLPTFFITYAIKMCTTFLENLHIFGTKFLTPNTIFIAFLSINIF